MKIGIITCTYRKLDGSTYEHLKKTLESVKSQTHDDYKLFLIGDNYSDNNELLELSKIIPEDKLYVENLPVAVERIKYDGIDLWCNGGVNATNVGIKKALSEGYEYLCLLNHDDFYTPNHLSVISNAIEYTGTNFITTRCGPYPNIESVEYYTQYRPIASRLYLVTVCLNFAYYNMLYRNMQEECGRRYPADADLWNRINKFMSDKNEYGILVNEYTCSRSPGGITKRKPEIVK